jgi:DNA-binding CsgD family transcriptional regulator
MELMLAEIATDAGLWDEAAALLPENDRSLVGLQAINAGLRRAELALGYGDHATAADRLTRIDRLVAQSAEPQFHGPLGALLAELRRRQGDLDGARRAVDEALDRIEFCTEDVARLARVSAVGVTVEADRAQRGRDLADAEEIRRALLQAEGLLMRVQAAAEPEGPVERAWLAHAEAAFSRAHGDADPALAVAAAEAWDAVARPYPAAEARWRAAEAHIARGDREAAAPLAAAALETARRLGAGWLTGEVEGLAARARLGLEGDVPPDGAEDPFGLTPRERQVLELVARGRTNREIGAALYMAEKTASVHVSRILAKLDVRSRTEAAAVAHRLGLTD